MKLHSSSYDDKNVMSLIRHSTTLTSQFGDDTPRYKFVKRFCKM